jgi:ABC-type antimicrobial peptide transport system permease subunit
LNEAIAGLLERPARTLLTVLGSALGITAVVASLGLSRTAAAQILVRFDQLQATSVEAVVRQMSTVNLTTGYTFPVDSVERIKRLNGVDSVSVLTPGRPVRIRSRLFSDYVAQPWLDRPLYVATPNLLSTIGGRVVSGRMFDQGHSDRRERVCVIGKRLAQDLNIGPSGTLPAIFLGPESYTVLGVIDDVERRATVLDGVIVPEGAGGKFGYRGPDTILIRTQLGAAEVVAEQTPLALSPDNPTRADVRTGRPIEIVRQNTKTDLDALFAGLAVVVSIISALGIANMTLVSVFERVGEIGLRRSLGARSIHIASQFLVESTILGIFGGVLGATVGIIVIVATAAVRSWTPVLELWIVLAAPILGGLVGLLSGLWPALRAARLEPVDALRRGV